MELEPIRTRSDVLSLLSSGTIKPPEPDDEARGLGAALYVGGGENTIESAWFGQLSLERIVLLSGEANKWEAQLGSWSGKEVDELQSGPTRFAGFRIREVEAGTVNLKLFFDQRVQFSIVMNVQVG